MKIGIVTGASSGIGREFVYALDQQFDLDEIWVIARREERLKELQEQYGNEPDCPEALKNAKDWLHLPFCTRACARPVVAWLNKKEPDEYRYGSHYGLPRTKYGNEDDDEEEEE